MGRPARLGTSHDDGRHGGGRPTHVAPLIGWAAAPHAPRPTRLSPRPGAECVVRRVRRARCGCTAAPKVRGQGGTNEQRRTCRPDRAFARIPRASCPGWQRAWPARSAAGAPGCGTNWWWGREVRTCRSGAFPLAAPAAGPARAAATSIRPTAQSVGDWRSSTSRPDPEGWRPGSWQRLPADHVPRARSCCASARRAIASVSPKASAQGSSARRAPVRLRA